MVWQTRPHTTHGNHKQQQPESVCVRATVVMKKQASTCHSDRMATTQVNTTTTTTNNNKQQQQQQPGTQS